MSHDPHLSTTEAASSELLANGMELFEKGAFPAALAELEKIPPFARPAPMLSALGLCIAEVRGAYKIAANLCHEAIKKDPKNPVHYFHQGRILLLAGRKKDAIWVFRMGLRHGKHNGIISCLGELGIRRPPPIEFLDRRNPFNKIIGIIMTRLNLR